MSFPGARARSFSAKATTRRRYGEDFCNMSLKFKLCARAHPCASLHLETNVHPRASQGLCGPLLRRACVRANAPPSVEESVNLQT